MTQGEIRRAAEQVVIEVPGCIPGVDELSPVELRAIRAIESAMTALVKKAVEEEREACIETAILEGQKPGVDQFGNQFRYDCCGPTIAQAIRERKERP